MDYRQGFSSLAVGVAVALFAILVVGTGIFVMQDRSVSRLSPSTDQSVATPSSEISDAGYPDDARVSDVGVIKKLLESYYSKHQGYPVTGSYSEMIVALEKNGGIGSLSQNAKTNAGGIFSYVGPDLSSAGSKDYVFVVGVKLNDPGNPALQGSYHGNDWNLNCGIPMFCLDSEQLKQVRDSHRISDMSTMKSAMELYEADLADPNIHQCEANTVYASAPILPPAGWKLGPNPGKTNVDGTGWVPVDLRKISSGAPILAWPKDPANDTIRNLVYVFFCEPNTPNYKFGAWFESAKLGSEYTISLAENDGGKDPKMYEVGTTQTKSILGF